MRKGIFHIAIIGAMFVAASAIAAAQHSATANFGSFYGAAQSSHSVNVIVGTAGVYQIESGGNCSTPVGTVNMPTS